VSPAAGRSRSQGRDNRAGVGGYDIAESVFNINRGLGSKSNTGGGGGRRLGLHYQLICGGCADHDGGGIGDPGQSPVTEFKGNAFGFIVGQVSEMATPATAEMESVPCSGPEPVARAATIVLVSVVTTLPKVSST